MTPSEREELFRALAPNLPGATANAIDWLITLLARVENLEDRVDALEDPDAD